MPRLVVLCRSGDMGRSTRGALPSAIFACPFALPARQSIDSPAAPPAPIRRGGCQPPPTSPTLGSAMRTGLAYTSARILLFVAATGLLYLAGARGLLLVGL